MFISSALLLLASLLPLDSRQEIDDAKYIIYDHLDNDRLDSAHWVVDQVIAQSESMDYNYGHAKSIFIKSYLHRINNELGESFVLNLEALRLLHDSDDPRTPKTVADIYISTGGILNRHYQYDQAIQYYDEGVAIAFQHDLNIRLTELTYLKAVATMNKEHYAEAFATFEESLRLSLEHYEEWTTLNSLNYLGVIAQKMGKLDLAREYFHQIIDFQFQEENKHEYLGFAYHNLAETYAKSGDLALAEKYYDMALEQNYLFGDAIYLFETQVQIAELFYDQEAYGAAMEIAEASLESYPHTIQAPESYRVFDLLTNISFATGDVLHAREYHEKFVSENNRFLNDQQEILEMSEQYKMELLTASYFKEIEKQEQMAQLNKVIYLLILIGLFSAMIVQIRKYMLKRSLERAVREVTEKKGLKL